MKSRVLRNFVLSFAALTICFSPLLAYGQWHPDSSRNTPVCDTTTQQTQPQCCTDDADGAIFVWEDNRSGTSQIYAQRIDLNGIARWTGNGVMLSKLTGNGYTQTFPIVTTDDSGGAYVVWQDSRYNSTSGTALFAQHILANGAIAYADTGLPVAIGKNTGCKNPTLCDDGFGGAFVAWEDNRALIASTRPDIWMNRLWRNTVKYGIASGSQGTVTIDNTAPPHKPPVYIDYFHDPNANFATYFQGLYLNIVGKGAFLIGSVVNDTMLTLKSAPPGGTYAYTIGGLIGLAVDTMPNKQTAPCIVNDGYGGCYLAWTTNTTSPNSIYGTHIDSTCRALWDPAPGPGFQLYISNDVANTSNNVTLYRDSNQLLLAWETTSSTQSNTEQIFAQRMNNTGSMDTSFAWGSAVEVTSDVILNKSSPLIFGDDSVVLGSRGVLVPFINEGPLAADNYDIAMVRVQGSSELLPPIGDGYWYFEQKQHAHNDFQAVKVTDPSNGGTHTGVLSVWTDPWDGTDTMLYAQRLDRSGTKYFPSKGTFSSWGLNISGNSPSGKRWAARQPCMVGRSDGAIVGWADYRSGTPAIYCQLILNTGALWIPYDTTPPVLSVVTMRPSDNDSACNSQSTTILAQDSGALAVGIDAVILADSNNMSLVTTPFTKGAKSVNFTVSVKDSLLDGTATVTVEDTNFLSTRMNFSYCTIADTNTPMIIWDSLSLKPWESIHVRDTASWSRGLSSISVSNSTNVNLPNGKITVSNGKTSYDTTVSITDSTKVAHFAIQATSLSGISSTVYNFSYAPAGVNGVTQQSSEPVSISIFPNPVIGSTTMQLAGAPEANVTVTDILGRTVDQFLLAGSREWQPGSLASGTYIVRAIIGDLVISKRIVKQ